MITPFCHSKLTWRLASPSAKRSGEVRTACVSKRSRDLHIGGLQPFCGKHPSNFLPSRVSYGRRSKSAFAALCQLFA